MSSSSIIRMLVAFAICSLPMVNAQAHPYPPYFDKVVLAHGIMGALAWVVLFPLGGLIIRLCNFRGVFWAHVGIQILAYAMFCFVFATGCWFSWLYGSFAVDHVIIGIIVFILASVQPFLGTFHHRNYKLYSRRTWPSILHLHLGRTLVTIGIINGGLGLYIAENASKAQLQAYGAVSGIIWLFYILVVSYKESSDVRVEQERYYSSDSDSLDDEKIVTERSRNIEERNLGVYE